MCAVADACDTFICIALCNSAPSPPQTSQYVDTFLYFTTCIVYVIVVWLFLFTIALLLLQVRRESSATTEDRRSSQSTLRATAQLAQRMSLQLSSLAILVVVCFFFRAGYAFRLNLMPLLCTDRLKSASGITGFSLSGIRHGLGFSKFHNQTSFKPFILPSHPSPQLQLRPAARLR